MRIAKQAARTHYAAAREIVWKRLSSRSALVASFASGLALGWARSAPKPRTVPAPAGGKRVFQSAPKHWLRSYIIWPFLLATVRDAVVSRRPTRR